jgi:hypothetical protein
VLEEPAALVRCRELPSFRSDDPQNVWRAFRHAPPLRLRQAWREELEPDFAPATVRVGWRDDLVLVFVELTDADIFSDTTGLNQKTWLLGDTFEIFLQPPGGRGYVELHVTPNNQRLQLRYDATTARNGSWEHALVREELFRSTTWVWPEAERWFVYAEIPVAAVSGRALAVAGSRWRFSFSRYDYRRGRVEPILSSTSVHAKPDFHRQHEWGVLCFET